MKTSSLYFKTLFTSFAVLAVAILVLLYGTLENTYLVKQTHSGAQEPSTPGIQYQKLQKKVLGLQDIIAQQKKQSVVQRDTHNNQADQFIKKISELQMHLAKAERTITQTRKQLADTMATTRQLTQQLEQEKSKRLKQENALASVDMKAQALDKNLNKEKQRIRALRVESTQTTLAMADMANQLNQNKSALIKNRRKLATSNQVLRAKSREFIFNQHKINDVDRTHHKLALQIATITE